MDKKEVEINFGWSLIMHKDCSLFIDVNNANRNAIFDWDNDNFLTILVGEDFYKIESSCYCLKYDVNISNKTITLHHEPEKE